jgi:cation transport protein ChaC
MNFGLLPGSRDPQRLFVETLKAWGGHGDVWVFGYASLIWRPEFEAAERRPAMVYGWHRALEMRSRVNRGTPECPGLVFALVHGGCCRGMFYRIE